jgi:hypothetical protein
MLGCAEFLLNIALKGRGDWTPISGQSAVRGEVSLWRESSWDQQAGLFEKQH